MNIMPQTKILYMYIVTGTGGEDVTVTVRKTFKVSKISIYLFKSVFV